MSDMLPDISDFVIHGSLDEESACRHMLGRTVDEVRQLLDENFIRYQEDFMWMGAPAFRYYVTALIGYVKSLTGDLLETPAERDDLSIAASLQEITMYCTICRYRLDEHEALRPCARMIAESLEWIAIQIGNKFPELSAGAYEISDAYFRIADDE